MFTAPGMHEWMRKPETVCLPVPEHLNYHKISSSQIRKRNLKDLSLHMAEGTGKKRFGIIGQIYILVLFGMIFIAIVTYSSQYRIAKTAVFNQAEEFAFETTNQVSNSLTEIPAHTWLFRYWHDHAEELDIEYDIEYYPGTRTQEKYDLLNREYPDFHINYATEEDASKLLPEDQKLFAEIAYSWMNTTMNNIKRSHKIDHLYCVITDKEEGPNPYGYQYFLLSGAEAGENRGTEPEDAFILGKVIDVKPESSLRETMKNVVHLEPGITHDFDTSGNYADYYVKVDDFGDKAVLIGVSYSKALLTSNIRSQAREGTRTAVFYEVMLINIIMLFMYLYEIRPLKRVLEAIRIYTDTKDSADVSKKLKENMTGIGSSATRNNEIGQLSDDFISLVHEIDNYVEEIEVMTAKRQQIDTELGLAATIQESMLKKNFPLFPDRDEFDEYALADPARSIGGDFYDFILIDDDHLALVIADVSGKGVPAALFMMMAMVIVQSYATMIDSPAEILEEANNTICTYNENDMFVTVWIGILEISTGKVVCANAGHEFPALMKAGGEFEMIRDPHGFVMGALTDMKYREYTLQMEPGDKLFVYTDGVREAMDIEKNMFGEERIIESLNLLKEKSPQEIVHGMLTSVETFAGEAEQFDDTTMLCIEYDGPVTPKETTEESENQPSDS